MLEWYYKGQGEPVGPLTPSEIRKHALEGKITHTCQVRQGPESRWVRAEKVRGLFDSVLKPSLPEEKEKPFPSEMATQPNRGSLVPSSETRPGLTPLPPPALLGLAGVGILALVLIIVAVVSRSFSPTTRLDPGWTAFGGGRDGSFKRLATEKETRLKQLLNKNTQHGRTEVRNFRPSTQGDNGTIEFGSYSEVDGSSAGLGILRDEIGYKATYAYRNGRWEYLSSERQLWDAQAIPLGWTSTDMSRNETDLEILRVLK